MTRYAVIAISVLLLLAIPTSASKAPPKQYSSICVEHIGESDEFIPSIFLSTSESGIEWCRNNTYYRDKLIMTFNHIVPATLMSQLSNEVQTTRGQKEAHSIPFGTFAITTIDSKEQQVLILDKTQTLEPIAVEESL